MFDRESKVGVGEMEEGTTSVIENRILEIDSLIPHPRNFRQHPDTQLSQLGASHERFGQFRSVVVVERDIGYTIVAGHGIVEAMKRNGVQQVRADVLPRDTSDEDVEAILVADNLLPQGANDDNAILAELLQEQMDAGFDLEALGSDEEMLRQMVEELGDEYLGDRSVGEGGDDFDTTPAEGPTRTHVGELWALGEHRLLVADSTKSENVKRLMRGEKAVLMATDPPYGDSWVKKAKDMQAHGYVHSHAVLHGSIESDDLNVTDLKAFLMAFLEAAKCAGDPPMPFYVWHRAKRIVFENAFVESGYFVHQPVVWVKPGFVIGRLHYHPRCEWALHGWRQGNGPCPFYGERNQSDVWEVARENDKIHPTQKPLELFAIPIRNHTLIREIIYDPFAGSGTCLISAHRLGRRCYVMEVSPIYADVILRRYETETGDEPELLERIEIDSLETQKEHVN